MNTNKTHIYKNEHKELVLNEINCLSEDIFTVKYMERSTGKTVEINPNINDAFFDTFYANMFRSGAFILISGELPAKWQ